MKKLTKRQITSIKKTITEKVRSGMFVTKAFKEVADELGLKPTQIQSYYYNSGTKPRKRKPRKKVETPEAVVESTNRITIPIKSLYIQDNALVVEFSNLSNLTFPICY